MSPQLAPITKTNHCSGPRTPAGKAASARNSLRHGLASGTLLIPGEDASEWETLLSGLREDWAPESNTERLLVESMAKHQWLIDRALRLQGEALAASSDPTVLPSSFAVLLRYQTTNERAFYRAQKALETLQRTRREFVSQKAAEAENAAQAERFARLTVPFPTPDYDKILERLREARQPAAPTAQKSPGS